MGALSKRDIVIEDERVRHLLVFSREKKSYIIFFLQLMDRAIDVGDYFLEALKKLAEKHEIIGDIRGRGMFIGIDLVKDRETREPNIKAAEHALTRFREERILMQVCMYYVKKE